MDTDYRKTRPEFECSCYVLATVVSNTNQRSVLDVGSKGIGVDHGEPEVVGHPEAKVLRTNEEHTIVLNFRAAVGDKVLLLPAHACTTVHLYREMWLVRADLVEDVWPIEGSGCLQ